MKVSAQNIKGSSGHFEAIFKNATSGILITDSSAKIIAINPFLLNEFGYTEKELLGKKVEILIPSRYRKKHSHYHEKYIEVPQTRMMGRGIDFYALRKDGTEFPVEINLSNYEDYGSRYVIVFINNISIRKKVEKSIEKLHEELEETVEQRTKDLQETLLQLELVNAKLEKAITFQKAILKNAGAIIISTDKNGIIQTFNPEAEKELGYSAEELIGKQTPLIFHDKIEIKKRAEILSRELKKDIPAGIEVFIVKARMGLHNEYEWTYITKNKKKFPVLLNITSMKDDSGNLIGYLGVSVNISERKKIEQELQVSYEKEKELSELKSRFVSMASHEFRTPLSTILSSAYLIEKYTTDQEQPKRSKHLQHIFSSVTMLTDILNDFLSVDKIEEGKIFVKYSQINVQKFLKELVLELKGTLRKGQKILYHHDGSSSVFLDISLLKHIIMNLVSNASKFSPEESPIEIKTTCNNNQFILSVKDHGIGISKEDQKHLMERFFRGANAAEIQGTGLGLHIVSKYADLMNGSVKYKSELEKGSEFIVTFKTKRNGEEKNIAH